METANQNPQNELRKVIVICESSDKSQPVIKELNGHGVDTDHYKRPESLNGELQNYEKGTVLLYIPTRLTKDPSWDIIKMNCRFAKMVIAVLLTNNNYRLGERLKSLGAKVYISPNEDVYEEIKRLL
jgi:hypothetical protein